METAAIIIFAVTYAGVAMGSIPGLALDRTGMVLPCWGPSPWFCVPGKDFSSISIIEAKNGWGIGYPPAPACYNCQ